MLKIKYKGILHLIPKIDILYCKAVGNYTSIFLVDERRVTVYLSLRNTLRLLSDINFFRCHNSTIINLRQVSELDLKKNLAILKNKTAVPISNRKRKDLMVALSEFPNTQNYIF